MRSVTLLAFFMCLSCSDKDQPIDTDTGSPTTPDDTSGVDETCASDDFCAAWEICDVDTCVDGDRNNSVDESETLLWDSETSDYLNTDDDIDYYTFAADGGEFIRVATTSENEEDVNTVVVIRSENGKIVTTADAYATETSVSGLDSVAYAYLADEGTYSISVESAATYYGSESPGSGSNYDYTLSLEEFSTKTSETDSAEDPSYVFTMDNKSTWTTIGVLLESEGDRDYVSLDYPIEGATLYLDGNQDLSGSDATPRVRLLGPDGTVYTDKENVGPDHYALLPQAEANTYTIEVSDADDGGGDNHWAILHLISRSDDPVFDQEAEPNNAIGMATPLTQEEFTNSGGNDFTRGQALGTIEDNAEEDWYSFSTGYDKSYIVVCLNAGMWGAMATPSIAVYDETGTLLGETTGNATTTPNANIENILVGNGTHYLQVRGEDGDAVGDGAWYRFNVYVASFSVSSYSDGGYSCP